MAYSSSQRLAMRSDEDAGTGIFKQISLAYREYGLLGSIRRFLAQRRELRNFVAQGADKDLRKKLLRQFANIHRHVICAHAPAQYVIIADQLLRMHMPGPIVQCGTYKGGSTAKLSLIAAHTNRRLIVCDSFKGLPEPKPGDGLCQGINKRSDYVFAAGEYCGSLEEVKKNVCNHGDISCCEFIPGWFADTLMDLNVSPIAVVIDVDFVSSARDCLLALWPMLQDGGIWFTHEAGFENYMTELMDKTWWQDQLNTLPPDVIGGQGGVSLAAPSLAYFIKQKSQP